MPKFCMNMVRRETFGTEFIVEARDAKEARRKARLFAREPAADGASDGIMNAGSVVWEPFPELPSVEVNFWTDARSDTGDAP